ncbi:hypothetical protein ACFLU6_08470 [Acidobacteriota bacterium]
MKIERWILFFGLGLFTAITAHTAFEYTNVDRGVSIDRNVTARSPSGEWTVAYGYYDVLFATYDGAAWARKPC